jgi:hypothetical protein
VLIVADDEIETGDRQQIHHFESRDLEEGAGYGTFGHECTEGHQSPIQVGRIVVDELAHVSLWKPGVEKSAHNPRVRVDGVGVVRLAKVAAEQRVVDACRLDVRDEDIEAPLVERRAVVVLAD